MLAFSAVGSLREEIRPEDFVVPDQLVDRTKGIRPFTFFEGGVVGHVGFAEPFDARLQKVIAAVGAEEGVLEGGRKVHGSGTLVCIEGPAFSTRAESKLYRAWGCDVVNMSCVPEGKLAREAEMAYVMVCMATDYDCWREVEGEEVSVEVVMGHMRNNAGNAGRFLGRCLEVLEGEVNGEVVRGEHLKGGASGFVEGGLVTGREWQGEARGRLEWLFGIEGKEK